MSYQPLGADGEDDGPYRPRYEQLRSSSSRSSFIPGASQFLDGRDRLAAQPTFSVENLAYSYGLHESYEAGRTSNQQPYHRPYKPTENARPSFNSFVPDYKNNHVIDCAVPSKLFNQLLPEQQRSNEFTHMRYTAATGDPTEFRGRRFELRQHLYSQPRQVELFIVVTMYNETQDLLARTLIGIFENINYMETTNKPGWGRGSWRRIVVCIVSDGVKKIDAGSRALLAGLGVYQNGVSSDFVNGEEVAAHVYEYTTQMEPYMEDAQTVSLKKGNTPIQLLFCLKQENQQKINSHRWFFQAFGDYLQPNICVLLDAGTKPGETSIYLLWNTFFRNPDCAGACGEIKADIGRLGKTLLNPLVATQNFEYKISNILDKPLESAFGFISVLPGAFSAYRFTALKGRPLEMYFAGEKMHDKSNFFTANMYLAEDRILCYELVTKKRSKWVLRYVKGSTGETDVPDGICEFISQRRRWLNGSFFAAVYTIAHFGRIWGSKHSFSRKILLTVEIIYQLVSMLFGWFALANFFLVFRILTRSCADPALLGKPGMVVAVLFEWTYLVALIACFILALGHTTKGAHKIYLVMVSYWAIVMGYLLFASIFVAVRSVQAEVHKGFRLRDLLSNHVFSTLILSMISTYALWVLVSFLFLDPWHMFTSFLQYLLMTPTYINVLNVYAFCNTHDLSWGTKGDTATPGRDIKSNEEGAFPKPSYTHPNVQYDKELAMIGTRDSDEKKELSLEEKKKQQDENKMSYYASVRSGIVMGWVVTNLALALVVLETSSISSLINSKVPEAQRQAATAGIYLTVVLWSVAGLSAFRFVGAMWFLAHRKLKEV